MNGRTLLAAKTIGKKKESSVFKAQKPALSQSTTSPIDDSLFLQKAFGNQAVQRLFKSGMLQAQLKIGQPNDIYEQEADWVSDQVMRMPEPGLQKKCIPYAAEEELNIRRKEPVPVSVSSVPDNFVSSLGSGQPLDKATREYFEPRFGADFSHVRVHAGQKAAESSSSINALAYTVGRDVVFGMGQYSPETDKGRLLLAHELTHVVQQAGRIDTLQCENVCEDPDYCTPYATPSEAASEESWLRSYWLPLEDAKYGSEVRGLWESYLNRSSGDSLTPVEFSDPSNPIVDSFTNSWAIADDQDEILEMVSNRLSRLWFTLRPYTITMVSLSNFLSPSEMNDRPINFSNPFSIAGHIAGGVGSSDAGADYRKIIHGNVTLEKVPLIGSTGYIFIKTTLRYEIFDALDFCPGQCGSTAEQIFTVPLSRLEAGGQAYDVPYKVTFFAPSRSTRKFFA